MASGAILSSRNAAKANGRGRVAGLRLRYNLAWRNFRQLALNFSGEKFIGDDPEVFLRSQREQAFHRLLDHGLFAVERQHLFGLLATASGPEAGPAAAGKNHWIKWLFTHMHPQG